MNPMNQSLILQIDKNGVANLIFDAPNEKVNKLATSVLLDLKKALNVIDNNKAIRVLLISSAKKDNFIAGADINEIKAINDEKDALDKVSKGQEILDQLAKLKIPTICVINGSCLGGGLELALACKYRVGVINAKTILGLPEVNLGIIPGFGGTQRLPALVGLEESLKIILSGKAIDVKKAQKIGLIDISIHQEFLEQKLSEFVSEIITKGEGNSFLTGRLKSKKKRFVEEILFFKKHLIFYFTNKELWAKTKGQYLAPFYALEVVKRTYRSTFGPKGLKIEREAFAELAVGEISKNLIEIFFTNEALKKDYVDEDSKNFEIDNCALMGAGVMGGGIGWLFADNNIKIRIKDISQKAIALGYNQVLKIFGFLIKTKKYTSQEVAMKVANISTGLDYTGFDKAQLIVEAVVENIEIKKKSLQEVEKFVKKDAIIASNTSSLSISKMAEVLEYPQRFAGMHFFNPVNRMPLVEIIRGQKTDEKTVFQLVKIARKLKKTAIVVEDVCGFLVNRILLPYILEASYIAQAGAKISQIDHALENFGMPMGPFVLSDTVGIDVGVKVIHSLENSYGARMKMSEFMNELGKNNELLGKKTNKGFYIYSQKKSDKSLPYNSQIDQILKQVRDTKNIKIQDFIDEEIVQRCIFVMINEASRCLEEKVVKNARYLDMAMIMGAGFPAFRGGLLRYADKVGINVVVDKLKELELIDKERYQVSNLLLEMRSKNEKFYQ